MAIKKILTATTVLASLAAGSAYAGSGAGVSLGGSMLFMLGHGDQSSNQEKALDTSTPTANLIHMRETAFNSDTHLYFDAKHTSDAGLTYGFSVEVETVDGNNDNGASTAIGSGDGLEFTKAYAFMESGLGRLEMGRPSGPTKNMKIGAETIARGNGGVDGDFADFIRTKALVNATGTAVHTLVPSTIAAPATGGAEFLLHPDSYIECNKCGARYANKVAYYTPMFSGFQLGVAYILDTGSTGKDTFSSKNFGSSAETGRTRADFENVFDVALSYQNQFDMIGFAAAATGQFGKAEKTAAGTAETRQFEDLRAYTLGAKVTYNNFSLAGGWADFSDSGHVKNLPATLAGSSVDDDQNYWNIGLSWEQGPIGLGIGYFDSENHSPYANSAATPARDVQKNDFSNVVLSADYALAPGLTPFAEVSFFDMKYKGSVNSTTSDAKNRGTVFMIGTKVMF